MPRPTHTADFPFAAAVTTERTIGEARNLVARRPEIERIDAANLEFAPGSALLALLADDRPPPSTPNLLLPRLADSAPAPATPG